MAESSHDDRSATLIEAVQRLTSTFEQIAASLVKLEALYMDMLQKQDEDRAENKERQKEFDERQKKWDERDKKWEEQDWWRNNPWVQPRELGYLFLMGALLAMGIAVSILAAR